MNGMAVNHVLYGLAGIGLDHDMYFGADMWKFVQGNYNFYVCYCPSIALGVCSFFVALHFLS